jgi:hypothetical protein
MAVVAPTDIGLLLKKIVSSVDDLRHRLESLPPDASPATRDQLIAVLGELESLEQSAEDLFDRMEAATTLEPASCSGPPGIRSRYPAPAWRPRPGAE